MNEGSPVQPPGGFLNHVRYFNKRYLNRLTIKIARTNHGPFAIVQHKGRRSGKIFETPIIVRSVKDGFVFALTYGPRVDWYQNILASGKCTLILHRREFMLDSPQTIASRKGIDSFPFPFNAILKALKKEHFFIMSIENKTFRNK